MKAIYAGVILDPTSREELKTWFATLSPLRGKVLAHHLTWAFKPTSEDLASLPIGQPVTLRVVGYANREGVQAVVVTGAETRNAVAHITVAVDQGVSPVRSNDVLAGGYTPLVGPELAGRWGWFDGKGDQFTLAE
jgi:hypothetical protein